MEMELVGGVPVGSITTISSKLVSVGLSPYLTYKDSVCGEVVNRATGSKLCWHIKKNCVRCVAFDKSLRIDEWFEGRTRLSVRCGDIEVALDLSIKIVARSDHCQYGAGGRINHHEGVVATVEIFLILDRIIFLPIKK